jgi:hypothetical protein
MKYCMKNMVLLDLSYLDSVKKTEKYIPQKIWSWKLLISSNEFKEKSKETCLEKYGVENYTKTDEYNKTIKTNLKKIWT